MVEDIAKIVFSKQLTFIENLYVSVDSVEGLRCSFSVRSVCKRYAILIHLKEHRGSSEGYLMFIQSTDSGRVPESLGCFGAGGA